MTRFDFKKITSSTRRYNLHTHTQFCDGRNSIEEICDAAERMGFKHLGFTPHSPLPIASPCNMAIEDVPIYIDTIRRMRERYPSMHIYTAMEVDYLGDSWGPASEWCKTLPLDYTIGSVHFIPDLDGEYVDIDGSVERFRNTLQTRFDGDLRCLVDTFFDQSIAMVRTGHFDIIGHFDKIAHNASAVESDIESQPWYQKRLNELVEQIISSDLVVEINTKAFIADSRFFPNENLFSQLNNAGVRLVVNSDAHFADKINWGRDEALELLDALNR